MINVVIMAGGKGERFWPKSRKKTPKQFLKIFGERTMLQATVERVKKLTDINNVYIVTGKEYRDIIIQQLPDLPVENIIIEPFGRNTAACLGLAAVHIQKKFSDGLMVCLPADHLILKDDKYLADLKIACKLAALEENIVIFGVRPNRPETGYGYIKVTDKDINVGNKAVYKVDRFVEKPDIDTAKSYLESGNYLWNSGMFVWKISTFMNNMKEFLPGHYNGLITIQGAIGCQGYDDILKEQFDKMESISVDYGIMEKARSIYVVPCDFTWDDVGSWTALERIHDPDKYGNIFKGDIIEMDTQKCIVEGNGKLIAMLGVENLVVVDTDDVLLICSKERAQEVKKLLAIMKEQEKYTYL